jgi:hypothetical protein
LNAPTDRSEHLSFSSLPSLELKESHKHLHDAEPSCILRYHHWRTATYVRTNASKHCCISFSRASKLPKFNMNRPRSKNLLQNISHRKNEKTFHIFFCFLWLDRGGSSGAPKTSDTDFQWCRVLPFGIFQLKSYFFLLACRGSNRDGAVR